MKGSCLCGGVTVTLPGRPEYMNSCNCSACFRLGSLTGYFPPSEVSIEGETKSFVRSDIEPWIAFVFCPTCSASVGWTSLKPLDRMGVSMRLFDPDALVGVPVRFPNGRARDDADETPAPRRSEVPFARDAPF